MFMSTKWIGAFLVAASVAGFSGNAFAQCCAEKKGEQATACSAEKGAACSAEKAGEGKAVAASAKGEEKSECAAGAGSCESKGGCGGCGGSEVASKKPRMQYKVAGKVIASPKEAAAAAKDSGEKVQFVLAGKTYADPIDAKIAYMAAMEKYAEEFASTTESETDSGYQVAGKSYTCENKAKSVATACTKAAGAVKVAYHVGEQSFPCHDKATAEAVKAKLPIKYEVDGKFYTDPVTARTAIAIARITAMETAAGQAPEGPAKADGEKPEGEAAKS